MEHATTEIPESALRDCFNAALVLPAQVDVSILTYQKNPAWDSVAHMRLVASIETAFGIMLTTDEILDMSSYNKAYEIVKGHGVRFKS